MGPVPQRGLPPDKTKGRAFPLYESLWLATVFHEAERLKSETMFSSPSIPEMMKDWQHWFALWGYFKTEMQLNNSISAHFGNHNI